MACRVVNPLTLQPGYTKMHLTSPLPTSGVCLLALSLAGCSIAPQPLTGVELAELATSSTSRVTADQEPVSGPIGLHEAMARALKYNLDFRVEMMQRSLRAAELDLAHYNLLPNAVANSGYAARNSYNASGELNLATLIETPARTTSLERKTVVSDITFSWSVIDFGLSWIRARQAADRVLIAEEAKRKVVQRVIEDVRTAYWRAVSADRMTRRLAELEQRTKTALDNTRWLQGKGDTSPITALTYERELVEIKRTAQELQRELSVAKTQLAALMNLKPGTRFELSSAGLGSTPPALLDDGRAMIEAALLNRSELRDIAYQSRINAQDGHAALLELLPGIQLYAAENSDTNKYLAHDQWVSWGAKASWNLLRVFQYPAKRDVIAAQDKLLDSRALALTMAIMTQVHVAQIRYRSLSKELATARTYHEVQSRLVGHMRSEAKAERISEQTLIREELNTLVAEVKRDIAFAAVQNAFANVYASVGLDPYADALHVTLGVKDLAAELRALWLERGEFGGRRGISVVSQ